MSFNIGFGTARKEMIVDGPLEVDKPLVLLVHGLGGRSMDWTDPVGAYPGLAYDTTAQPSPFRNEGAHGTPPPSPVAGFFTDPPRASGSVTSWRDALLAAGFSTANYEQVPGPMLGPAGPAGPMAGPVAELASVVGALAADPRTAQLQVVILAHSRGGLIARIFLARAAPAARAAVTGLITLHSPHQGSGLVTIASAVNTAAAGLQSALTGIGVTPPAVLAALRGFVGAPSLAEMLPGSGNPLWSFLAGAEPVSGVRYHTFGGISTVGMRIWARVYHPSSAFPVPLIPPRFFWSSSPAFIGAPLDPASFAPLLPVLAAIPGVAALIPAVGALAALAPDALNGFGDVLVADQRTRLTFAAGHTTNRLNHLEALFDPRLQAQVIGLLRNFAAIPGSGFGGYDLRSAADRVIPFAFSSDRLDHLVAYRPGQGTLWVLRSSGGSPSSFSPVFAEGAPGTGVGGYDLASAADRVIPFDYNSSGRLDHLVAYRPGQGAIYILRRDRRGLRRFSAAYAMGDPGSGIGTYDLRSGADRIVPFDFAHSGHLDHLVMYRPGAGVIYILRNANGRFSPVLASASGIGGFSLGSGSDRIIPFDWNPGGIPGAANARPDHLLLYRPGTGTVWILRNGAGSFTPVFSSGSGIGGYDLRSPADRIIPFDGARAGRLDHLLAYRPGQGTVWVLANRPGGFTPVFAEGAPGRGIAGYELDDPADRLVPFDYLGSGICDHLLAFRPGAGIARVLRWDGGAFSMV